MKALQPDRQPDRSLCEPCVYFSGNLDPSYSFVNGPLQHFCGLDFIPGDDKCVEMRTNDCSAKKNSSFYPILL
jgi:hypothetical protein